MLADTQSSLRQLHTDIGEQLNVLAKQVDYVRQHWQGASADGFQRTVAQWQAAAGDLHDSLASIHNMVAVAHDNHAGAVHAGVKRWRGRTR
ncbi:MAG: WXG100 family type VII secretion target [Sciscionella sp.]|nr:WXG100 family type VII secretion target [Sciscionella sp.]